jgi:hypothetical protein
MEPYTYKDVTASRLRLIGNGSAQSRKFELPSVSDTDDKEHNPEIYAKSRRIYPHTFDGMLNCSFVTIDITKNNLAIKYYEVPQIALGKFAPTKVLYHETIML